MCYEARVRFETRVRMQVQVRDLAIFKKVGCGCNGTRWLNKYYKYFYLCFLYIFTIKIFLKNTLLCPDSQNKERRRQETPLRSEFQLFQQVSRSISACFDRIVRRSIRSDMAWFWPNQPSSAQIEADSAWIEPRRHESSRVGANPMKKKKKKLRRGTDARSTASDSDAAPSLPRPCFIAYWSKV